MSAGLGASRIDTTPKSPRLETLVTEFAIELTMVDGEQVDDQLGVALERLADKTEADAVTLLRLNRTAGGEPADARVYKAWSRSRESTGLTEDTVALLPFTLGKLQRGEAVSIDSLGATPDAQASERAIYEQLGISALYGVPLRIGSELLGALLLGWRSERRAWVTQLAPGLRGVAAVLASALARRRSEHEMAAARSASAIATLAEVDRAHILEVLRATNWVVAGPRGAAARLGMKRSTLNFRMQKLGIARERR